MRPYTLLVAAAACALASVHCGDPASDSSSGPEGQLGGPGSDAEPDGDLGACPALAGVPYSTGRGIPFDLDPGVHAAGWLLNTNDDGEQNYGESAVDCGGAGDLSCAVQDHELVQYYSTPFVVPAEANVTGKPIQALKVRGRLDGNEFMFFTPVREGQEQLERIDEVAISIAPTRGMDHHRFNQEMIDSWDKPDSKPFLLAKSPGVSIFFTHGSTHFQPFVHTAQQAVNAAQLLRQVGFKRVYLAGGSYGGAASLFTALTHSELFDGAYLAGSPLGYEDWDAFHEYVRLVENGLGRPAAALFDNPTADSLYTTFAQAGTNIAAVDLRRFPESARIPIVVDDGEADVVWYPGATLAPLNAQLAQLGYDWVSIKAHPEARHGDGRVAWQTEDRLRELFQKADGFDRSQIAPLCPEARRQDNRFDEVLTAAPGVSIDGLSELYADVGLQRPGQRAGAAAAVTNDQGLDDLVVGSTQGWVTRFRWVPQGNGYQLSTVWRVLAGRNTLSVVVADVDQDGQDEVVVGNLRGLQVLDAQTGSLERESTRWRAAWATTVGDLLPEPGPEICYIAAKDILTCESGSSGELLVEAVLGTTGRLHVHDWGKGPRLYAPLARGHVVQLRFEPLDPSEQRFNGRYKPVAEWLSPYLESQLMDLAFVQHGGHEVMVTGGMFNASAEHGWLYWVDHGDGKVGEVVGRHSYMDGASTAITQIEPGANGEVLVGGAQGIKRLSLGSATNKPLVGDAETFVTGDFAAATGSELVAFGRAFDHTGMRLGLHDAQGGLLGQREHRASPTAMTTTEPGGQQRLVVLDRDWQLRSYDLEGSLLGIAAYPAIPPEQLHGLHPRGLVATGPSLAAGDFEIFAQAGGLLHDGLGTAYRVENRFGRLVVSRNFDDPLLSWTNGVVYYFPAYCVAPGSLGAAQPVYYTEMIGPWVPSGGFDVGTARVVDLDGPESHVLQTTAGGKVALFAVRHPDSGACPITLEPVASHQQPAGDILSGADAGDVDGDGLDDVVVGSSLRGADGETLAVLSRHGPTDSVLALERTADVGRVSGLLVEDLDGDGRDEIVVGTVSGVVRVLDGTLQERAHFEVGDLDAGQALLRFLPPDSAHQGRLVVSVAGGYRVLGIESLN